MQPLKHPDRCPNHCKRDAKRSLPAARASQCIVIRGSHLQGFLHEGGAAALFSTLTHEIGHVLGAWQGGAVTGQYAPYTDVDAGTWTGPHVVALHGGPAPFQDASDPKAWVEGERDPLTLEHDFAHSGVCASLMAYCGDGAASPPFLPQAIDFAFLADLGMTVVEETGRPETYGLAGWTDFSAFTLSVSRDLHISLADPQPYYHSGAAPWYALEVTDLLQAGAHAFGYRSTGDLGTSYPLEGSFGTVGYAGGLIGAAIDVDWMPPVIGDATLTVDLGTLDGTASFTSLAVYSDGERKTFASGAIYHPIALSDNTIVGTETGSTLLADFYGPRHEEVAGTLLDPRAGLLASFGATHDDRPDREAVVASADYLAGLFIRSGATDPAGNGWFEYRCETGASCELRDDEAGYWNDWTTTTRGKVLSATAGWDRRSTARLVADRDSVRIARQSATATDGRQGRHVVDGYTGTMMHSAFGTGFETYSAGWTDPVGTPPSLFGLWTGVQGTAAGRLPGGRAQWSGLMLGYQFGHPPDESPFVEGRATIDYHLSPNRIDVMFSAVEGRDRRRVLPDFGFENTTPQEDGTFAGGGTTGTLTGAFFGPGLEEVTGVFNHRSANIYGSFGTQAVPDAVTLEDAGSVDIVGSFTDELGTYSFFAYDDWGFWGRQFGEALFGAFLEQSIQHEGNAIHYGMPEAHIYGTPTGSNPVSGGAVWNGKALALDVHHRGYLPVSGSARLEVDLDRATVDVELTDFDGEYADLSWQGLQVSGGSFRDAPSQATIEGAFYGMNHQGVAGEFDHDDLQGVFGAVRN